MTETAAVADNALLRKTVYAILIAIGIGAMIGRILAVDSVDLAKVADLKFEKELTAKRKELQDQGVKGTKLDYALMRLKTDLAVRAGLWRPFQSANDRSRWCTVRALVEPDLRVPDAPYAIDKVIETKTVDGKKVKVNPGWDTIDMVEHNGHYYSSKPPLLSTLMAAEYWVIFNVTHQSLGTHPYEIGRFMLITINGLCLLLLFIFTARLIERLGTSDWGRIFVMAACVFGTSLTTFAVTITNHVPAAACTAVLLDALVRIWFDGDRRAWTFIIAGFFSAMLAANEVPAGMLSAAASLIVLVVAPRKTLLAYLPPALLVTAAFFATNWIAVESLKPVQSQKTENDTLYHYPGSYWNNPQGVDADKPPRGVYTLHLLIGQHGIFSLTPIWLLSMMGAGMWLFRGERKLRLFALIGLAVTIACIAFYIGWPNIDHNYGGNASAFRWVFWMAPLWLALMLPAADAIGRRAWSRGIALALLLLSALACNYPTWNPWSASWIMNFAGYVGWL